VSAPQSVSPEAATVATRAAAKLGCETVALIGCVRPPLIEALSSSSSLAGFDDAEHLGHASAERPHEAWRPLSEAMPQVKQLASPFVVISARALDALDDAALAAILGAAPAALVIDVDGHVGHGLDALYGQVSRLSDRGLSCLRAELIAPVGQRSHRRSSPALMICDGHDSRALALVETGFHSLRLDPEVDTFSAGSRPARVCIVSYEVVGPHRNGGIGTANTSLALALGRAGHEVILLFTGDSSDSDSLARWRRTFSEQGVLYDELDKNRVDAVGSPHKNVRRAWAAYEWVLDRHVQRRLDVIHGPDCQGHLAFIALAKRHGIAFTTTEIVTGVHSPTRWCNEANRQPMDMLWALADDYLERTATEASDVVVSPSGYMLSYLKSRGWRLPPRTFIQQYMTSQAIHDAPGLAREKSASGELVSEIVFFGRLEVRKGIEVFCDALDELAKERVPDLSITFMGSAVTVREEDSATYIERRSRGWPWSVKIMTDLSQTDAVAYLGGDGRLAVMPSLVDNSPNTVYEAIALGIPFIVSRAGGTAELIALDDVERCSFAGEPADDMLETTVSDTSRSVLGPEALGEAIRSALGHRFPPVRPSVDRDANDACHIAWHAALAAQPSAAPPETPRRRTPRISVILTALELDGVSSPLASWLADADAEIVVAVAEGDGVGAGDQRLRVVNAGRVAAGRALGLAAQAATGEVLLTFPIDVIPEPRVHDLIARAAARSAAEVFVFPVRDFSERADGVASVVVPLGGPALLGLSYPYFGSCGFAIRAEALVALGGFTEAPSVAAPCLDLLNRAALAGYQIDVVPSVVARRTSPDPLRFLYRNDGWLDAMRWTMVSEERQEILRPFERAEVTAGLPALYRRSHELLAEIRREHARLAEEHELLGANAERVQRAYDELHAHAKNVEHVYEALARSDQELRSQLEVVYGSRSWRITAPIRRFRARWRST
jgi:glycosyltransferase involved in cell wall biosynthesis